MTSAATSPIEKLRPGRSIVVTALGVTQILAWGSSYYLLAVLAGPIAVDTGWSGGWVVGALSLGLLVEGLVAPRVGDAIERHGGRYILAASSVLLAAGMAGLAAAPSLPFYVAAWVVIGLGMSAGLYDAAFSTLGRLYGLDARRLITLLTLFGGFASTVCWPLTALLNAELGWRGTCVFYACVQLAISLPIHWYLLPREPRSTVAPSHRKGPTGDDPASRADGRKIFMFLAIGFAITSSIASVISVHLITLLTASDFTLAAAVALGALLGPSQVAARMVELAVGRHYHPIWAMAVSSGLIALGIALLHSSAPVVAAAVILYGGGMGIKSIVRGTMPLAVFGARGYASLMGRLAMPSLLAGAAAPFAGAVILDWFGAQPLLSILLIAAILNLLVVVPIWRQIRPKTASSAGPTQPL
jgi:hypothetical protein